MHLRRNRSLISAAKFKSQLLTRFDLLSANFYQHAYIGTHHENAYVTKGTIADAIFSRQKTTFSRQFLFARNDRWNERFKRHVYLGMLVFLFCCLHFQLFDRLNIVGWNIENLSREKSKVIYMRHNVT
jgi:hypothetical protein